ncbi:DUF6241 domain-containing protein [Sporolactobacillus terrae]|uniref:Uncharacterized protein n=1 Tax=Sporolactobacillus terrae TaxID=269673 RepID=A0A5K7X289_9BACL|nr:DUF6241 domain-containing protein [Sporolactobacillus terrae]BBN99048.1 hypothetical protein St703_17530 [Sporolactobacillus terrae]
MATSVQQNKNDKKELARAKIQIKNGQAIARSLRYDLDSKKTAEEKASDDAQNKYDESMKTDPEKTKKMGLDGFENPNPFGEPTINRANVSDSVIQRYLLKMSSNKTEITKKRIDWLLSAVSIDKMMLKHKSVYKTILTKWKNNNLTNLDDDAPTIKHLQS